MEIKSGRKNISILMIFCLQMISQGTGGSIINMSSVASSIKGEHFRWEHLKFNMMYVASTVKGEHVFKWEHYQHIV